MSGRGLCRACRRPLAEGVRFCTRCGAPTPTHERTLAQQWRAAGSGERRAAVVVAGLFVGMVVAILAGTAWEGDASFVVQDGGMILVGALGCLALGRGAWRRSLAGRAEPADLGLGVAVGLAALAIGAVYVVALQALIPEEMLEDVEAVVFPWWALVIAAPLIEEWLTRGVAWEAARRIGGERFTLMMTSALFALSHGLNGGFLLEMPHRFVAGLLFGWLRLRSGSLIPSIVAHFVLNASAYFLQDVFA